MGQQQSPIHSLSTQPAQFLFRVYHNLIREYEPGPLGHYIDNTGNEHYRPLEISYTDHLFSMPADTETLVRMASQLAYADACLLVKQAVNFVVVWLVEAGKPVDSSTPVTVFHPFLNARCGYYYNVQYSAHVGAAAPDPLDQQLPNGGRWADNYGPTGFLTYNLTNPNTYAAAIRFRRDAFSAVNIARGCETGRAKLQFIKGPICWDDFYIRRNGNWVLNVFGTLYKTRFPFWAEVIEGLPYTHSGWSLKVDGSIHRGRIALTDRVCNGVSRMAQQWRMFKRRKPALNSTIYFWQLTAEQVMRQFRLNELLADPVQASVEAPIGSGVYISHTVINTSHIVNAMRLLVDFLNLQAIASGSETLILEWPFTSDAAQEGHYNQAKNKLLKPGTAFEPWMSKGATEQAAIVMSMVDLLGGVMDNLTQFSLNVMAAQTAIYPTGPLGQVMRQAAISNTYNAFALVWPTLQGDVLAVFGLLMSWQLTWDVYEKTRGKDAADVLREPGPQPDRWKDIFEETIDRSAHIDAPHLDGRFSWDLPEFAPFRIWDVDVQPSNINTAQLAALKQQSLAALQANLLSIRQAEAQRKAARRIQRDAEIADLKAKFTLEGTANPNDPWDYRNYTNSKWWTTPIKHGSELEFVARALDTPDEIEEAKSLFGLHEKVDGRIKRIEPIINRVKELTIPQIVLRDILKDHTLHHLVYDLVKDIVLEQVDDYIGGVKTTIYKTVAGPGTGYSPRQFWPQYTD
jgi:hypothetical protein